MSTTGSSVGANRYGGRRRHGLAWVPWLALLLLALIALGAYLLIHNLTDDDDSSPATPTAATAGRGTDAAEPTQGASGVVPLVGGGGVALSQAKLPVNQTAATTSVLGAVLFAQNSATLDVPGKQVIANAATLANQRNASRISVSGYTDVVGNVPANSDLSEQRATAVANELRKLIGSTTQISTVAKGEQDPVAANSNPDGSDNPEGRQQNRRAVIAIS